MGIGTTLRRRAVFLDRDGVINVAIVRDGKPYPPSGLTELQVIPGVAEALARLRRADYLLIIVSNQPDVARGTTPKSLVEEINQRLRDRLPIDEFRMCYHDSGDGCACRKPLPGMLLDAAKEHDIDLGKSFMVGDRWRDIEAGHSAGCRTFFVDRGYAERRPVFFDYRVDTLREAVDLILGRGPAT